ncbi:sulfate/molybdate ABC transporter ATP-binding protein [Rhodobacter sp.]
MSMSISNLTRRFGQTEVLRGIDLEVASGELVALLGPSGSGKTTLLKIIAGLDWPDAGQLSVGGQDWLTRKAQKRRTGFVFQHYALFPHMTVRDNIAFGLTVMPGSHRPPPAAIAAKVEELLHFLQIPHLARRFPAELSGGQRQRVALGRALAIDPAVLLLDEPFGALDAQVRRDLRRWLREVHDKAGTTTIFVTHDQEEAFELADRVVVMGAGLIEQIGRPDQIYDHPATPFVARFLGLTVELPVTLRQGRAVAPGIDAAHLPRRAMADGPATLFLRPADITPVPAADGAFRVTEIATTGALLRLRMEGPADCRAEAELPRRAAPALAIGQTVTLRPEAGQIFPGTPVAAEPAPVPAPVSLIKESLS